jgi:hypothetical protein
MALADLWTCPKCKRRFANRNQTHFCGHQTVEQHLRGRAPLVISLYQRFVELVKECGPVTVVATKTRIGFQVRMTFAAVSLRKHHLACHVVLSRRLENQRFKLIQSLSPRNHVHHFRIGSVEELDDEVAAWLKEAYKVGEQKHHVRRSTTR